MLMILSHTEIPYTLSRYIGSFIIVFALLFTVTACHSPFILEDFSIHPSSIMVGSDDEVAEITYTLKQPASVDIALVNSETRYVLRAGDVMRKYPSGKHTFLFTGLVNGYLSQDEHLPFEVIQRLAPAGEYQLVLTVDSGRDTVQMEHPLFISNTITTLPEIQTLEIDPRIVTPNEDGLDDAARITLRLTQNVEKLTVYAVSESGNAYPVPELEGEELPNAQGLHTFYFDALDVFGEKLVDGAYTIIADVFDTYGQHIRWQEPLTIQNVGKVEGYIKDAAVIYSRDTVLVSETLCFSLTVLNTGDAYMRTTGPWSSTTYVDDENFATLKFPEDKGIFRIGLDFDSSDGQYPFRWSLGTPDDDLVRVGNAYYLPPHSAGFVRGCVLFTAIPKINPQYAWVGLIHEQAEIPLVNHRVAPIYITVREKSH